MPCSCSHTPIPPTPPIPPIPPIPPSFLEIVNANRVTPPNATHKLRAKARVGNQVHDGTGLLTYTSKDGILSHTFQFIPEDPKGPQIPPVSGIGFQKLYEYRSKQNGHYFEHSFITNTIHSYPDNQVSGTESDYHISAEPAICTCVQYVDCDGNCQSCQGPCEAF